MKPKEKIKYSMLKLAGNGWLEEGTDALIEITVVELKDQSSEIRIKQKDVLLKKGFLKGYFGKVYDEFMWLSSQEFINYDSLIRYDYQRVVVLETELF